MESQSATHALYAELTEGAGDLSGLLFTDPRVRTLAPDALDAARTAPAALQSELRREFPGPDALALLVAGCVNVTAGRCANVRDWGPVLHQPMARCFTLLSAVMPIVRRAHDGGHAVLVASSHALVPDPEHGPGSVLGRGLLGLFADALQYRPLFALPASLPPTAVRHYFGPIAAALRATPAGAPLPAGPKGAIYRAAVEAMQQGVTASDSPSC